MHRTAPLLIALALLTVAATAGAEKAPWFGSERLEVMKEAKEARAYRIEPNVDDGADNTIAGHPVVAEGPVLSAAHRKQLLRILRRTPPRTDGKQKRCKFLPGVAVRFSSGEEQVTLLICFQCSQWKLVGQGDEVISDFDRSRPALLRLARRWFPKDQALKKMPLRADGLWQ